MIYLDYQATTPVAPEVADAMRPWIEERFANPHSPSRWGREAQAAIEVARDRIAAMMPSGGEVYFTAGATEALNWAIKGACTFESTIALSTIEHAAVLDSAAFLEEGGATVRQVPVTADGIVDVDAAASALAGGVNLFALMLVNNEIGTIQPVERCGELAHSASGLFLCDAVQGFGRVDLPANADLIAVSAHKIHGPKGVGALWVRNGLRLRPLIHGGGQERGLRSGTLSPALCVGLGAAARLASERRDTDNAHAERLWRAALEALGQGWTVNGSIKHRYFGNLNLRREGLDGARLISDVRDIALSLGSACASGSGRPSHVLRALGLSDREARSSIRLGFGRYTTEEQLTDACRRIDAAARAQQGLAA